MNLFSPSLIFQAHRCSYGPFSALSPVQRAVSRLLVVMALGSSLTAAAQAQPTSAEPGTSAPSLPALTLREAAQAAVLNNPEVLTRFHTAKAAVGEKSAAQGALLPRLDVTAGARREQRNNGSLQETFSGPSNSVVISQLLYDGFATRNEVKRLDYARLVRLYEFLDASEAIALEASRAYFDVLRFRELVRLAEENYVQHRSVYTQTDKRVQARVARGVDLEQISGRLALAEANLLTETSNLHDTTARFQRIIGRLPPPDMPLPAPLSNDIPAEAVAAIQESQRRNNALLATIENVRSLAAALDSRRGAFGPRVDLRLRRDRNGSLAGSLGGSDSNVAEVVLNWNLFSGGADTARTRQFSEQLNAAKDLRDKACRDTRQTLLIAYNDTRKLKEQIGYLDQHKVSIEKARNAYRQQFDIGQRTLLDLLDTENELFQARRAVANAEQDLNIAYARTQAGMGALLPALNLSRIDIGALPDATQGDSAADMSLQCPQEPVILYAVDKKSLDVRADELLRQRTASLNTGLIVGVPASSSLTVGAQAVPGAAPTSVGASSAIVPAAKPKSGVAAAADAGVNQALEAWRAAWTKRDVETYLAAYVPGASPTGSGDRKAWEEGRRARLSQAAGVAVEISDLTLTPVDATHATTVFKQSYRSAAYQDVVTKTLAWERINGRWLITRESSSKP